MTHLRHAPLALGLAGAAALGFVAARFTRAPAPAPAAPAQAPAASADHIALSREAIAASQIGVAPAAAGEVDAAVLAAATVKATPDAEAVLTARAAGTVTRIFVGIGDAVRAGQTLALVESRDASQIAADRAAAAARATLAAHQLDRERTLLAKGVSPRADFEAAQANLAVAQADARRASAAASAVRVAADGRSIGVGSPIAGRVTAVEANLGRDVAAETELFRVADPRRLQIAASVPPADAARVRLGDRVEMTAADGRVIPGRVRAATGVVDPLSRAVTIVVALAPGAAALAPGELVRARILASGGAVAGGVAVPQDAVQMLGGRTVVFARTQQGFRAVPVRAGARGSGMVAITGGLRAGTPIATTNAFLLKAELEKNQGGEE